MSKNTVVFDFDGVIHSYSSGWKGDTVIPDPPVPGIKEAIADIREDYFVVVVSTRCTTEEGKAAIEAWLSKHGIEVDKVTKEKPPAVVYIDDRAICFDGNAASLKGKIKNFEPWYHAENGRLQSHDGPELVPKEEAKKWVRECEDLQDRTEAYQWYHEYHVLKDELKTEKMYHRATEKLADKYFVECKHLQEMLDAAIAGQESLQRYLDRGGEWEMQKFPLTKCSVCGYVRNCEKDKGWKFCPECGAKMK